MGPFTIATTLGATVGRKHDGLRPRLYRLLDRNDGKVSRRPDDAYDVVELGRPFRIHRVTVVVHVSGVDCDVFLPLPGVVELVADRRDDEPP